MHKFNLVAIGFAVLICGCDTVPTDRVKPTEVQEEQLNGPVYELRDLDRQPRALLNAPPHYPRELRRAGIQGSAQVEFVVNAAGNVIRARILRASESGFAEAALEAVRSWKFKPAEKNGVPVNCRMESPITFSLDIIR